MRGTVRTLCFLACFALAVTTSAQEGHPLVESGHGDWGTGATGRQDLTVSKNGKPLANARSVVMASTGKKLGAGSSEGVTP